MRSSSLYSNYCLYRLWRIFFKIVAVTIGLAFFFVTLRSLVRGEPTTLPGVAWGMVYALSECMPACGALAMFSWVLSLSTDRELPLMHTLSLSRMRIFATSIPCIVTLCCYLLLYAGVMKPHLKTNRLYYSLSSFHTLDGFDQRVLPLAEGYVFWNSRKKLYTYICYSGDRMSVLQAPQVQLSKGKLVFENGVLRSGQKGAESTLSFKQMEVALGATEKSPSWKTLPELFSEPSNRAELHRRLQFIVSPLYLMIFGFLAGLVGTYSFGWGMASFVGTVFFVYYPLFLMAKRVEKITPLSLCVVWAPALVVLICCIGAQSYLKRVRYTP